MFPGIGWWSRNASSENTQSSGTARRQRVKPIEINDRDEIYSVRFLADGRQIVIGGWEGKIRCLREKDGTEAGMTMDAGSPVYNVAVSRDSRWVVSGTVSGEVTVWNAETHEKMGSFQAHKHAVDSVDVSPDGTRIATGSGDKTACVWSLSTGQRLLGPLQHDNVVVASKFSPDGRLIATATWWRNSVRVYDAQSGRLLVDAPIKVKSLLNQSLVWANDSRSLFALSHDGNVHCLDASTGTTRCQWLIHSNHEARCIALTSDGTVIAASSHSSVSFWDAATHNQVGSVIQHPACIQSMAISANGALVMNGGKAITLRRLHNVLLPSCSDDVELSPSSKIKVVRLEENVRQLRNQLFDCQRAAAQEKDRLAETINVRCTQNMDAEKKITRLEEFNQQLRNQLSDSRNRADTLNETIISLHRQNAQLEHQLRTLHADFQRKADDISRILHAYGQQARCTSVYDHKDPSTTTSGVATTNGVDGQVLPSPRHRSKNVRQKLCLAATRIGTNKQDMIYSLFDIFNTSVPVAYGENQQHILGRFLQELLTRTGDVSILAWTGKASEHNSCLPAEIGVFRETASLHAPSPIDHDKMDTLVAELRASLHIDSTVTLYDRLALLPCPRLASGRLSLPCIMFPARGLLVSSVDSPQVYHAMTSALGNVVIKTTEDLSGLKHLVLVHPWLQYLLDPAPPFEDLDVDDSGSLSSADGDSDSDTFSFLSPHSPKVPADKLTRALRLFARLRQPFGALLLVHLSHNEYKRVASDHPIVVQLLDHVSPRYLVEKIRTLDIL